MVKASTILLEKEIIHLQKITTLFTRYLKEGNTNLPSFINFCRNGYSINPKLFQHFFEVSFPKKTYSLQEIQCSFPNIQIHDNFVDNSMIITALQAEILKQNLFFKDGNLIVMNPPTPKNVKRDDVSMELEQTKQENPDYQYLLDRKTNTWRYYDLKTGDIHVNRGHVISTSDPEKYKSMILYLLNHQKQVYNDIPEIYKYLRKLSKDLLLTPEEKNDAMQQFYLNVIPRYPKINPSLVFKHELSNETQNIVIPKTIEAIINSSTVSSAELTENAIAKAINNCGETAINTYQSIYQNNKNILKLISTYTEDTVNTLKNTII